ncbi:transporter [Candidatus Woesearchaeota archaeon]|nr:transporter [Candidatus Woesearchaeota archaeon]
MQLFLVLLVKVLPLLLLILLGYLVGKYLRASKETVASLLIYIMVPPVMFLGVLMVPLNSSTWLLPLLFFALASLLGLVVWKVSSLVWKDSTANLLAFFAGTGNTGYFGLPVALALFGDKILGIMVLGILGFTLYETSIGYYIVARGHHTMKESIVRVFKLPALYAVGAGIFVNVMHISIGEEALQFLGLFKSAYPILGMMLIGIALAEIKGYAWDIHFLAVVLGIRFIVWPIIMAVLIIADMAWFSIFTQDVYHVMILLSVVPLAANSIAYASHLKARPEKASLAVLLSTLLAVIIIPIVMSFVV